MTLGEKMLEARLESGLSQRQLCDGLITRNMLSQIEHGTARPSMDTLRQLAVRLEKPVSWFLDENALSSPNQQRMKDARKAVEEGDFATARKFLLAFQLPDEVYARERESLLAETALELARQAAERNAFPLARQLLEEVPEENDPERNRKRLLLQGRLPGADLGEIVKQLPSLDEELLLRAEAALVQPDVERALALLEAVENQKDSKWRLLRGKILLLRKQYAEAAVCLKAAEEAFPEEAVPLLETCFRELGDYRSAYLYACRQR